MRAGPADSIAIDQELLDRAEKVRRQALDTLDTLGLMERWSRVGQIRIVGAVRYGLACAPDIDLAIYSEHP